MTDNPNMSKVFSNDKKRRSFLAAYRDWGMWVSTPELGLDFYRFNLPGGTSIIAMEYCQRTYDPYKHDNDFETFVRFFVKFEDEPFLIDNSRSLPAAAGILKSAKSYRQNTMLQ